MMPPHWSQAGPRSAVPPETLSRAGITGTSSVSAEPAGTEPPESPAGPAASSPLSPEPLPWPLPPLPEPWRRAPSKGHHGHTGLATY